MNAKVFEATTPSKENKYFVFTPYGRDIINFFKTEKDRDAFLSQEFGEYFSGKEWAPDVTLVCAGELTHIVIDAGQEVEENSEAKFKIERIKNEPQGI